MQKVRLYNSALLRVFAIILCIAWAGLIFSMSAEASNDSAQRSDGITEVVVSLLFRNFEDMTEAEQTAFIEKVEHIVRKIAHFGIFAVLGVLVSVASYGFIAYRRTHFLRTFIIGVVYAASDEIHQYFVPGRGPKVTDVMIDGAGVFCGAIFVLLVVTVYFKRKEKHNGTQGKSR